MIRPFALSDLDSILNIEREAFPKSPYDWSTFIQLYSLYPKTFLVYVGMIPGQQEGPLLGYIIFSPDGHIISIAVHPQQRRKWIGKKLLQRVIEFPHAKKIWAEVRRSNKGAQAFYFRMGFKIVRTVPNYYGKEDALIIQWIPTAGKFY